MNKFFFILIAFVLTLTYFILNFPLVFKALVICFFPLSLIAAVHALRVNIYSNSQLGILTPIKANALSVFFSMIIPGRATELLKPAFFKKKAGITISEGLAIIIVERIYDVLTLLLFLFYLFAMTRLDFVADKVWLTIFSSLLFTGIVIFLIVVLRYDNALRYLLTWLPGNVFKQFTVSGLSALKKGLREGMTFKALCLTLSVWFGSWGVYWLFFFIYCPQGLSANQSLVVFLVGTLGLTINITPGGLGTFEGSIVAILYYYGFSPQDGLIISFGLRMIALIPSIFICPVVLLLEGRQLVSFNFKNLKKNAI